MAAERRLRGLATGSFFSSGLSVAEFALLDRLGLRPLAQVMGASVFQVGWQYLPLPSYMQSWPTGWQWRRSSSAVRWNETVLCELDTINRAWDQARRRALDRLTEEALQVDANAVVGVRLHRGEHDWTRRTVDYVVSGTAVRLPGASQNSWPLLTDLSAQDYYKLHEAGYESVGLVATTAVVFVSMAGASRWRRARTFVQSQEFPEVTKAIFAARDTLRARLLGQARDNHGDGIVGVQFEQHLHEDEFSYERAAWEQLRRPYWQVGRLRVHTYGLGASDLERRGLVVTLHGAGTAIRARSSAHREPPIPTLRLAQTRD